MRRILFILSLLIFSIPSTLAVRKVDANPINIAVVLSEQPDSASIASTCEYYGYELSTENSDSSEKFEDLRLNTVYTHPNGSVIRYSLSTADSENTYTIIEVSAKVFQKEKDRILKNLRFQKKGNAYERQSISYTIRCTNGSRGSLIIKKYPKTRDWRNVIISAQINIWELSLIK